MNDIDSHAAVSDRLRLAREAANFKTAADAARTIGLKPVTVRAHESGQNGLSYSMIRVYCEHYNVTPQYLLWGSEMGGGAPSRRADTPAAYAEIASDLAEARSELAKAQGHIAYLKDGLRKLLDGLG